MEDLLTQQITIADILDKSGVQHKRSRCACPIHGGDNPSAFSFNEETYFCHTRGCKGNTITLIKELWGVDYPGVLSVLRNEFGVLGIDFDSSGGSSIKKFHAPVRLEGLELTKLKCRHFLLSRIFQVLTHYMGRLRERLKKGQIGLSEFYSEEQKIDLHLQDLDVELANFNYEIGQLEKMGFRQHA